MASYDDQKISASIVDPNIPKTTTAVMLNRTSIYHGLQSVGLFVGSLKKMKKKHLTHDTPDSKSVEHDDYLASDCCVMTWL